MPARRRRRPAPLGAESLESRRVLSVAPLVVRGDADPAQPDDVIVVEPDPAAPQWMQFTVNGDVVARRPVMAPGFVIIEGGAGNDVIRVDVPSRRSIFVVRGGDGDDHISIQGAGPSVIVGGNGDDTLIGGRGVNRIHGNAGDDVLIAGSGRNVLAGGPDADRIFGHRSKDRIVADASDVVEQTRQANPLVRAGSLAEVGRWLTAGTTRSVQSTMMRGIVSAASGMAREFGGMATTSLTSAVTSAASNHSGTNNQVAGVEEADLVQTDGRFIYLVGDGTLRIIDAAIDRLAVVAEVPVAGAAGELFLHGDRVTVVTTVWRDADGDEPVVGDPGDVTSLPAVKPDGGDPEAGAVSAGQPDGDTVGVGVGIDVMGGVDEIIDLPWIGIPRFRPQVPEVRVTVIDVSDRSNPVVLEEMAIDGTLAAARSIGDRVHLVIDGSTALVSPFGLGGVFPGGVFPAVMSMMTTAVSGVVGGAGFDSATVRPGVVRPVVPTVAQLSDTLPRVRTTTADGVTTSTPLVDIGSVHLPLGGGGDGIFTIVTFSPVDEQPGIDHTVTTLGLAGVVHAAVDTLVIASTDFDAAWKPITVLNTFALGAEVVHLATGTVPGWVPNQFAVDAATDGRLRVVAHEGWRQTAATAVHVLERQGLDLRSIGRLGGIAPGEDLKAARFLGDMAYVVTFEEIDPLFAIDLSNPRRPRVAGELKIPGFSTYLQAMEPGRLFGIGRGDEPGTAKVSLFDVSNMAAPKEIDAAPIVAGEGWSHSEAATEHRAFSWFPERGLLAVPFTNWNWNGVESSFDEGLRVFGVDRQTGFTHLADVRHDAAPVRRSLRIGETLFSVSSVGVMAHDLADGLRTLGHLKFG